MQAKKDTKSKPYADRAYHKFVKEMLPLETEGSACDRFRRVVQKWKSQRTSADEAMERVADHKSVIRCSTVQKPAYVGLVLQQGLLSSVQCLEQTFLQCIVS